LELNRGVIGGVQDKLQQTNLELELFKEKINLNKQPQ
jgi:hypothetical protein